MSRDKAVIVIREAMDRYFILILILAIALVAVFYTGVYWSFDDGLYVKFALQIANHNFSPGASPYSYAWLFPYFAYLSGALFGFTSSGLAALTAIEYLSLICLTYLLGKRLSKDRRVPLLAAFMVCVYPFTVQYSTRLLSDMLLGMIATLSLVFLFSERKTDWILAGAMAGFLIYIKLIALAYLLPFLICAALSSRRKYIIPPLIFTALLYFVPFMVLYHDPLYPFMHYGSFQSSISPSSLSTNAFTLSFIFGDFWLGSGHSLLYQTYPLGLLLPFGLMGYLLSAIKGDAKMLWLSGLFLGFLLYVFFGTITLTSYTFQAVVCRYFITVAAPLALLIAYAIVGLAEWFRSKKKIPKKMATIIVVSIVALILISLINTYSLIYVYNYMIRQGIAIPI